MFRSVLAVLTASVAAAPAPDAAARARVALVIGATRAGGPGVTTGRIPALVVARAVAPGAAPPAALPAPAAPTAPTCGVIVPVGPVVLPASLGPVPAPLVAGVLRVLGARLRGSAAGTVPAPAPGATATA